MAIWKYKLQDGWHILYGNILSKVLRKDKNLSDLEDISAARENLELSGDVITHNHDSRYMPLISGQNAKISDAEAAIADLKNRLNQAESKLNTLQNNNTNFQNSINAINTRLSKIPDIYVQTSQPSEPKDKSIWFDMTGNGEHVRIFWQNVWKKIGAVWK